jgi:hypothetical protein
VTREIASLDEGKEFSEIAGTKELEMPATNAIANNAFVLVSI